MPQPGKLRHRITIQKPSESTNEAGEPVLTWTDDADVWADLRQASGTEQMVAAQQNAQVSHRITMRYRDFKTSWRLTYCGRTFDVQSAIDPDERKQWLKLDAVERDAEGV